MGRRGRKYARDTTVTVSSSRNEIQKILERWGAKQMQWSDDFENGKAVLRFLWWHQEVPFMARFELNVQTETDLRDEAVDLRNGQFSQIKYNKLAKRRGMSEHRELFLLLKAMFVAVDAGIIKAEQLLLPFLEDQTGAIVSDVVLPHLAKLNSGSAKLLVGKR